MKNSSVAKVEGEIYHVKVSVATARTKEILSDRIHLKEIETVLEKISGEKKQVRFEFELLDTKKIKDAIDNNIQKLPPRKKTIEDYRKEYPIVDYIINQFDAVPYEKKTYRRNYK